jgi:type III pantothenate kinase
MPPMLLAVDIGNTHAVCALYDGAARRGLWRARTDPRRAADEYAALLSVWLSMAGCALADIRAVALGSVVPAAGAHFARFCAAYMPAARLLVADHTTVPVPVALPDPAQVGADRLLNALAIVRAGRPLPAVVVDFGTAVTFDVVDAAGRYAGGAIAPGVDVSAAALSRAAARLPGVPVGRPARAVGTDTRSALEAGLYWGFIGAVERILAEIAAELKAAPFVLATGGLATTFAPDLPGIAEVDPDLTLKGLVDLAKEVR